MWHRFQRGELKRYVRENASEKMTFHGYFRSQQMGIRVVIRVQDSKNWSCHEVDIAKCTQEIKGSL